jgi:hypothetical protein
LEEVTERIEEPRAVRESVRLGVLLIGKVTHSFMLFVKNIKRKGFAESMVQECDSMGLMASDTGPKLAQLAL